MDRQCDFIVIQVIHLKQRLWLNVAVASATAWLTYSYNRWYLNTCYKKLLSHRFDQPTCHISWWNDPAFLTVNGLWFCFGIAWNVYTWSPGRLWAILCQKLLAYIFGNTRNTVIRPDWSKIQFFSNSACCYYRSGKCVGLETPVFATCIVIHYSYRSTLKACHNSQTHAYMQSPLCGNGHGY